MIDKLLPSHRSSGFLTVAVWERDPQSDFDHLICHFPTFSLIIVEVMRKLGKSETIDNSPPCTSTNSRNSTNIQVVQNHQWYILCIQNTYLSAAQYPHHDTWEAGHRQVHPYDVDVSIHLICILPSILLES